MKTVFHVLGLAHQPVTKFVPSCAYTMKVVNMCKMLQKNPDYRVVLYHAGHIVHPTIAERYEECVPDHVMAEAFGHDFHKTYNQGWAPGDRTWRIFLKNAARRIMENISAMKTTDHVVLASFGDLHQPACPQTVLCPTIEMGVGYYGIWSHFKVWESYAWQHHVSGRFGLDGSRLMHDTVIPNYYNLEDFRYEEKKEDYFLYLGRVVPEKGVLQAIAACKAAGVKLTIVGKPRDPDWLRTVAPGAVHFPEVGIEERRELLAKAQGLFCLTQYVEPFGGVAVEAAISGTPVIASDWGAFSETVVQGKTGWRVRDESQTIAAIKQVHTLNPADCRQWGETFSMDNIQKRYEAYFERCLRVFKNG